MTSKVPVICRAFVCALTFFVSACIVDEQARGAAPTPTAAQPGMPNSIAVIGDSMSAATGTAGIPASEQPQNSWSTGTNNSVNSLYLRLLAINPTISGKNYNLASNGEDMLDGPAMANNAPLETQLVTLQLGGNNLCKSNVASMTTVEQYRASFIQTLDILANRVPNALIQIQSVPDIYNLWFLRGAPNPPNDQPSSQAGTARIFWNLGLIPCQSLVANPTSMSQADIDRRDAVRARNIEYNKVLAEECEARLRCRFDRYATFNFSSNRLNPPDGPYAPRASWQFVDNDISNIDHFHPSLSGQTKMAQAAWESGYNFTDSVMPTSTQTVVPSPPGSGVSFVAPTVTHNWTDSGGIKGVQFRTHHNDVASAWQTVAGSTDVPFNQSQPYNYLTQKSVVVPVTASGTTYVESRAMDANGNLSASRVTTVTFDPAQIPAPNITSAPASNSASTTASFNFSGAVAGSSYQCSRDGEPFSACTSPKSYSSLPDGDHEFRVRIVNSTNQGPATTRTWNIDATPPAAPQISGGPAALTNVTTATFQFTGEPGGSFRCSTDGAPFTTCTSPVQLSNLQDGNHTFSVRQIDQVGNTGTTSTHTWNIDATPPAAPQISGGPAALTNVTTATFQFTGEPGGSFRCSTDGAPFTTCTSPVQLSNLQDGNHTFSVRQIDQVGNTGTTSTHTWNIDATPPAAPQISGGPAALTNVTTATFQFTGEPGGSFRCSTDGAPFTTCTSPVQLSNLQDGNHTFSVRQIDQVGNTGTTSTHTWNIDATPPAAPQISGGPAALTNVTTATFQFTGEPGGSFRCSTDGAPFTTCTSPVQLSNLQDGNHTFSVRQIDQVGNTGTTSTHTWNIDATPPAAPRLHEITDEIKRSSIQTLGFDGEPGGEFECRINENSWTSCSSPWTAPFPGPGRHTYDVRQTDEAGNTGPAARGIMPIAGDPPPAPTITSAPTGTVRSTSAEVSFTLTPGASGRCQLDNGIAQPCDGIWSAQNLAQGRHTLQVFQQNLFESSAASSVQWTVDTVPPRLTGQVKAKSKGRPNKNEPRSWILTSSHDRNLGKPASIEFSTKKSKPKNTAKPVKSLTRKWSKRLAIRSKKKMTWVRVVDNVGNWSPWVRVR